MTKKWGRFAEYLARGLRSAYCWKLVLGLFVLEALWFVFSAQYPMAFDENYHFGLIQLHASQWLPFFTAQPHNVGTYGEVVRDPSYLYHWLMSYPYRVIHVFSHNQTIQIILLRLINVALFGYGLLLYRKIVRRLGASAALANALLAVFVLIPVVPFLAAHINYDNLFFVAVAATILLTLRVLRQFDDGVVAAKDCLLLLATLFLSSLIKYPFLPVFAVTGLYVMWRAWRAKLLGRTGLRSWLSNFRQLRKVQRVLLVGLCLLAIGLFVERYGQNIVTYHNPVPACDAVISQDECLQYGPYGRDQLFESQKPSTFHATIGGYLWQWLYGMWYRLFFAINYDYATAPPLFVISRLAIGLAVLLALGIVLRARILFRGHPERLYVLLLTLGYVVVLFADGFQSYAQTGQPVAINGRYLIPFLPFMFVFGGLAWAQLLKKRTALQATVAAAVLAVLLLQGGGTMTYIVRSNDDWMWNNASVRAVNRVVRSAAWPLILYKNNPS